jgi:hypothetical protein
VKTCKYCQTDQVEEAFEICRVVKGKEYRRLRCRRCKRVRTNERRAALREWLDEYKKTRQWALCGFATIEPWSFTTPVGKRKTSTWPT